LFLLFRRILKKIALRKKFAGWIFLFCFCSGCDYTRSVPVLAQVQESTGDAFVVAASGQTLSRTLLHAGMTIPAGQTVETTSGALATISLMPGMTLRVNPNSSIAIERLLLLKSGLKLDFPMKSRQARIELMRGSLYATTPPIITHVELELATPVGTLTAPALTTFYVNLDAEMMRAAVSRGQLTFRSKAGGAPQVVPEGQFVNWNTATGATSAEPRPVETDETVSGWSKEALDFERRASELTAKAGNQQRPPEGK
jgi:ferric-dicitrate binding protein FerR (iron transport regulator)